MGSWFGLCTDVPLLRGGRACTKASIGVTKFLRLYSNRVTSENKRIRTPPLSPPFKVGCLLFSTHSSNISTKLHGGDDAGKAIFPPFKVSET